MYVGSGVRWRHQSLLRALVLQEAAQIPAWHSQCWSKAGGGGITGRACFTIILQQVLHSRCCTRSLLHRMLFPWAGMPLVAPGMC